MQGSGTGNGSWNVRRLQRGVRVEGGNRPCRKVWGQDETVDELERLKRRCQICFGGGIRAMSLDIGV